MTEETKNQDIEDQINNDISPNVKKLIRMIENDTKAVNLIYYYMAANFTKDERSEFQRYIRNKKHQSSAIEETHENDTKTSDKNKLIKVINEKLNEDEKNILSENSKKANKYHKNKLKEYIDQLNPKQIKELTKQAIEHKNIYYEHGENNLQHGKSIITDHCKIAGKELSSDNKLEKITKLFEIILNSTHYIPNDPLTKSNNEEGYYFCASKWRIENKTKKLIDDIMFKILQEACGIIKNKDVTIIMVMN